MLTTHAVILKGRKVEVIMQEEFARIAPGDIVGYRMKAADRPTNPHRIWRGQVTSVDHISNELMVVVLDEGYEGENELVGREQIIIIEHQLRPEAKPSF